MYLSVICSKIICNVAILMNSSLLWIVFVITYWYNLDQLSLIMLWWDETYEWVLLSKLLCGWGKLCL